MPLLELVVQGSREAQSGMPKQTCLLITPCILKKMLHPWNQDPTNKDHVMLWAACCVGFFDFLQSGEFTASEKEEFNSSVHQSFNDIAVNNVTNPRVISVLIKQSKMDPFRQVHVVTIFLG